MQQPENNTQYWRISIPNDSITTLSWSITESPFALFQFQTIQLQRGGSAIDKQPSGEFQFQTIQLQHFHHYGQVFLSSKFQFHTIQLQPFFQNFKKREV